MTETWKLVVMQAEVARLGWDTGCGTPARSGKFERVHG